MAALELTLIVAATRDMGIGRNGTLPWTGLKKEMAYFARVTKRLPPKAPLSAVNAVIMGRKTWDSIPANFRPLKGRLNVVVSRSFSLFGSSAGEVSSPDSPLQVGSLEQAIEQLGARRAAGGLGRVFVIGGAQIYGAALELAEQKRQHQEQQQETQAKVTRVLLTRILSPTFECDTFFPLRLMGEESGGWTMKSKEELDAWTGEEVPGGAQQEAGTEYEFEMWERS